MKEMVALKARDVFSSGKVGLADSASGIRSFIPRHCVFTMLPPLGLAFALGESVVGPLHAGLLLVMNALKVSKEIVA